MQFDDLPFEVIDYILKSKIISHVDICNFSCVSKLFNSYSNSPVLWKKKYAQKWPDLAKLFTAPNVDWRFEFITRLHFKRLITSKLLDISAKFYYSENISNEAFFSFKTLGQENIFHYQIVINELENIIEDPNSHLNLTLKYYAIRGLRYMRHAQLKTVWREFKSRPTNRISLIEGACLVAQWCQPSVSKCASKVPSQIEEIARAVLLKIQIKYPQHPVVKKGLLDDIPFQSLWTPLQCRNILSTINEVMFDDLKFIGSEIDYYSADTSFIDQVLDKRVGFSITLGIIYSAVASKLGVVCLSVNFPGHFLLKWLEHPQFTDEKEAYTFIDVVEKGTFKKYNDLQDLTAGYQYSSPHWIEAVPPIKVFVRMAWYLVEYGRQMDGVGEDSLSLCNSLELLCLLSPEDMEHKLLLARLYMHLGINIEKAISMLQTIAAYDPVSPLTGGYMYQSTLHTLETLRVTRLGNKARTKLRTETAKVKFAVGMIMKHKKYHFRCVIYGWDYICNASTDWMKRMGVFCLEHKDKQPFYFVLVDDGTNRYAAEENLIIDAENKPIEHIRVGRYFESFQGNYYIPNTQTLADYPDDIEARESALS